MKKESVYTAIGLMSGTSLDGIDAALIRTNGVDYVEPLDFRFVPYEPVLREKLRACLGKTKRDAQINEVEREMTLAHAEIVRCFDEEYSLIGFHGHTLHHEPDQGFTLQIGDGALLAQETSCDVVCDFRTNDVKHGGQGAPLIPLYHRALAANLPKPCVILNIGGVANVTYIGEDDNEVLAFDTGPGNALIDDWINTHTGQRFDKEGLIAKAGQPDEAWIKACLALPYFQKKPPKSLDRDAFVTVSGQTLENGAATLTCLTVETIAQAQKYFSKPAKQWYVTGGGRHNSFIMNALRKKLAVSVDSVDALGWNGDALEAQGFAYLAIRSVLDLPLSLPTTTGVETPVSGGVLHKGA